MSSSVLGAVRVPHTGTQLHRKCPHHGTTSHHLRLTAKYCSCAGLQIDVELTVTWRCPAYSRNQNWREPDYYSFSLAGVDAITKPWMYPGGGRVILSCQWTGIPMSLGEYRVDQRPTHNKGHFNFDPCGSWPLSHIVPMSL